MDGADQLPQGVDSSSLNEHDLETHELLRVTDSPESAAGSKKIIGRGKRGKGRGKKVGKKAVAEGTEVDPIGGEQSSCASSLSLFFLFSFLL